MNATRRRRLGLTASPPRAGRGVDGPLALYATVAGVICVALAFPGVSDSASTQDAGTVGAYCPLPEPGETPVCLAPARAEYGEFFAAVEEGTLEDADAAALEADLEVGDGSERAFLALSSLSYGYWQLARRMTQSPDASPDLVLRLERWNAVLASTYGRVDTDPVFRDAVRTAALDLRRNAPRSESTDALVRTLTSLDANAGLRSPLERLIERLFGEAEDGPVAARPEEDRP